MTIPIVLSERALTAIQLGESHFREFKSALEGPPGEKKPRSPKEICIDIAQTLVAFANADGGELLVGVEDNGAITGIEAHKPGDTEQMENAFKTRVHTDTPLSGVRVAQLELQSHKVLYFSVKKGTELIHLTSDGRCLQRKDLASVPISTEKIHFDRNESRSRAYDRAFIEGPQADELDNVLLRTVADQIQRGMSIEKCLQYLDLAEYTDGGLTLRRAALLLFAKEPWRWHPRLQIRIIKVNGTEVKTGADYNVSADDAISGNILHLIEHGWDALRPHLVQTTFRETARFESRVMYPEHACREALVNAIAHRDYYQEGRGIEIFIFNDRMEVVNPGSLLSTVSVEDLNRLEGVHQSRNSLVARVLRELGYMRELGEGLRRIFELMTKNELAPPDLRSSRESFSITLHHKAIYSNKDLLWLDQFSALELEREKKAVVLLGINGTVFSPKEIWETLGIVDTEHYRKLVEALQKSGILVNEIAPSVAQRLAKQRRIPTREVPRFKIVLPGTSQPEKQRATSAQLKLKSKPQVTPRIELTEGGPTIKLYVGNVPVAATRQDIVAALSSDCEIVSAEVPMNGDVNRGYAVVEIRPVSKAEELLAATKPTWLQGRALRIRRDRG